MRSEVQDFDGPTESETRATRVNDHNRLLGKEMRDRGYVMVMETSPKRAEGEPYDPAEKKHQWIREEDLAGLNDSNGPPEVKDDPTSDSTSNNKRPAETSGKAVTSG